jgi:hypothetical protein
MKCDPVTGDLLTRSEIVSWRLQQTIRNFWFIGTITAVTIIMGIRGHVWDLESVDAWNFCMSWLALWIESIVGIAMFSQTRRDAKAIREVKAMDEKMAIMLAHVETLIEESRKE